MLRTEDWFDDRIENYKALLRAHYREGERLKRELIQLEKARFSACEKLYERKETR